MMKIHGKNSSILNKKIKPLKKIPSVRNEHYTVNISANNIF